MDGALETITTLEKQGWVVAIFSTRPADMIWSWFKKWCEIRGFQIPQIKGGVWAKPPARFYVDDRALRFTNWTDIKKYLL